MAAWSDFHADPRKSYYLFLRQGYGWPARAAYARVKQIDAMVMGLQESSRECSAKSWLASVIRLLDLAGRAGMTLAKSWEGLTGGRGAPPKPRTRKATLSF